MTSAAFAAVTLDSVGGAATAGSPETPVTLEPRQKVSGKIETLAGVFANTFGVPVEVKKRLGASGFISAKEVAAMAPDSRKVLLAAASSSLWLPLTQNVQYDVGSFTYVGQITEYHGTAIAKMVLQFRFTPKVSDVQTAGLEML